MFPSLSWREINTLNKDYSEILARTKIRKLSRTRSLSNEGVVCLYIYIYILGPSSFAIGY